MKLDFFERLDITSLSQLFASSQPFPHVIIDNFLPLEVATRIRDEFPGFQQMERDSMQSYERKIAMRPGVPGCPDSATRALYALNSHEMINFLEALSGISGLLPDPHFHGAGLQQTRRGGKLGVHIDFNWHEKLKLDRRLNVLIYLNQDWQEDWGGYLELWNEDMSQMIHKVLPVFNRCVIFATSDISYHGLPDPLRCPENESRKQINLYYYSAGRDDRATGVAPHWTMHAKRPGNFNDNILRPLEKVYLAIMPPILHSGLRRLARLFFSQA